MARSSWVYVDGVAIPKDQYHAPEVSTRIAFMPDLPDFVSPIDGQRYSGRAGMRNHNARHSVVPVSDLQGLPTLMSNSDMRTPEQKRHMAESRKEAIIQQVNRHYK
jgi:hypothetical protein